MLSIREVAHRTGLSTATISRALNPATAHKVRSSTREKILSLCESEKFRPSDSARSLATGKKQKIAFIMGGLAQDLGNQFQGISLAASCRELQRNGYNLLILGADNAVERDRDIIDFLRSDVADGYIIGESVVSDDVRQAVYDCGKPVVVTGKEETTAEMLTVRRDSVAAYREVWRRIPGDWTDDDLLFCMAGTEDFKYRSLLAASPPGRSVPCLRLRKKVNILSFDRVLTVRALEDHVGLLKKKKLILCASDLTALGVMDLLAAHGRQPGRDYFLVGYDNLEEISGLGDEAELSTIDSRQEEYGIAVVRLILEAIRKNFSRRTVVLPLKYISRKSFPF